MRIKIYKIQPAYHHRKGFWVVRCKCGCNKISYIGLHLKWIGIAIEPFRYSDEHYQLLMEAWMRDWI